MILPKIMIRRFYAFPNTKVLRKHIITEWEGDHINYNIIRIRKLKSRFTCFKYKSGESDYLVYFKRK